MTLPVAGSRCGCRHCAQISFIMHCIGELIEPIAACAGLRYGASTPCRARATAAIMRSEPIAMMRSHVGERDRLRAELARRVRAHRLHDVADERAVLRRGRARSRAPRRSTRRPRRPPPRSPRPCSGRSSSCSRRSRAPCEPAARNAWPIENSTALPRPPPTSTTVSPRLDLGRRAGRSHQHDRLAGLQQRAQVGRAAHLEHDRRHQALLAVDPRAGERQAFHHEPRAVAHAAPAPRSSAGGRTGPGGSARAAAGARTTTSTMVGVRRSTRSTVARSCAVERREERARRSPATPGATLREHARHDRVALLGAAPSPSPRCRRTTGAGRRRSSIARPSAQHVGQHGRALPGLARPRTTLTGLPSSSSTRKYLPSSVKCAASSRASTVLGCVPAATRIVRAGSVACAVSCHTPSPSVCCSDTCERRRARRARRRRSRAASGPRRSGCPPPAPSPLPRGSACTTGCRSGAGGRRWSTPPHACSISTTRGGASVARRRCALGADRARVGEELLGDDRAPRRSTPPRTASSPCSATSVS